SVLPRLPGPPSPSFLLGNFLETLQAESGLTYEAWFNKYGPVIRYHSICGSIGLSTVDPVALKHILVKKAYDYPKPEHLRNEMIKLVGLGLLLSEGDDHKRQRKLLNPTFSPGQLRDLTPVVFKIAHKLSSKWSELLSKNGEKSKGYVLIDTLPWMNRVALDIIGLAGFGHNFESLEHFGKSELANAFHAITQTDFELSKLGGISIFLMNFFRNIPILYDLLYHERAKAKAHSLRVMERETKKLLVKAQNKEAGKDFISVLASANKAEEGTRDKMDDGELMGQMTTFLFAGHETTASALTWQLWILAKHPQVQTKLREELLDAIEHRDASAEAEGIPLSMNDLLSLPYLNAFVREGMRLYPPVFATARVASHDDQIPLSKPVLTRTGEIVDRLDIRAGEMITIPIYSFNRSKEIFGESCLEFDPERWLQEDSKNSGVGLMGGLLSFLSGPRACIGYKFALIEMKAILLVLVTKFKFQERDEGGGPNFEQRGPLVMKPRPRGENEGGKMPLRVSLISKN
ncbi:cytochrome P450 monooxygenase, partial [Phakopsora pachyrhizi]